MPRKSKFRDALEHFNSLVVKLENGCWILSTKPNSYGYSQFEHRGTNYRAHVFSYNNLVERVSYPYEIHHKCENKGCCNPDHLEALTNKEHLMKHPNNLMHINKMKTHCPHGHEYTDDNIYWSKKGRQCKKCNLDRSKRTDYLRSLLNGPKKIT